MHRGTKNAPSFAFSGTADAIDALVLLVVNWMIAKWKMAHELTCK